MANILGERANPMAAQRRDPVAAIIAACAAEWGVTDAAIRGNSRKPSAVRPRHAAIWIAKQVTGRSTTELGEAFARDHTSILHALGCVDQADPETRAAIARVRERLDPGISISRIRAETMDRAQIAALGG
ncbi:helix-turn-helix domain-containing protein [Limimaricola sp. AA108-03]|uniref:helix-turn-helix domain-containing protein n=1 Tax=Limimaricola sp. AA108-03 TaxID=3425945 RepID=UPI003D7898A5